MGECFYISLYDRCIALRCVVRLNSNHLGLFVHPPSGHRNDVVGLVSLGAREDAASVALHLVRGVYSAANGPP